MSTETCNLLMETLTDLSGLYPDMRLGQLIEMVALLSGEETFLRAAEVEDDRLLEAASNHIRTRQQQLKTESKSGQVRPLPEPRAESLDMLQQVRNRHRDSRFGHLVERLATLSGSSLYDAEDEQLSAAARSYTIDRLG
jgi:hypothetical protein